MAALAAARLDAPWCDLDERVVRTTGMSIRAIFAAEGEASFRALERTAMLAALAEAPQVIAAGAGWAAEPGNLADAACKAFTIYLRVTPAVAAGRLAGATDRPLLDGVPPEQRIAELLAVREPSYRAAAAILTADDATPEAIAAQVVALARREAGW